MQSILNSYWSHSPNKSRDFLRIKLFFIIKNNWVWNCSSLLIFIYYRYCSCFKICYFNTITLCDIYDENLKYNKQKLSFIVSNIVPSSWESVSRSWCSCAGLLSDVSWWRLKPASSGDDKLTQSPAQTQHYGQVQWPVISFSVICTSLIIFSLWW